MARMPIPGPRNSNSRLGPKPGMAGSGSKPGSKDKKDTGSASGKQAKPGSDATKPRGKAKEAKPGYGPSKPRSVNPMVPFVISKSTSKKKSK